MLFYMANGYTIDDEAGGYVEEGFAEEAHPNWVNDNVAEIRDGNSWGHRKGEWNMYANREARFYASILYNGHPVLQVANADRDIYSSEKNKDGWGRVELYGSGVSGANGASDHSATGYLMNKFIHYDSNPYRGQHYGWRQHTYIRLATVYLNYIEALNEYDPNHTDIKKYWDKYVNVPGCPASSIPIRRLKVTRNCKPSTSYANVRWSFALKPTVTSLPAAACFRARWMPNIHPTAACMVTMGTCTA